jgi:TPR repeat protein
MAIFRANPGAFPGGNPNLLEVGTILNIPSRENVLSLSALDADRQVRDLIIPRTAASTPGSQVAVARPSTGPASPTEKPAGVAPGQEAAAKRYQDGLAMERSGDHRGALQAFLEAGNAGFGLAQRRLGQIYDMGSPAVSRDYQLSLLWYQKARDQGLDVGKQIQRLTPK